MIPKTFPRIPEKLVNDHGEPLRVLYLAPYAPDGPDFSVKPYKGNGGYPQYHHSIFRLLQSIGCEVYSSSKPYAILQAKGNVDYVFSLLNRIPIENPEIFISSYCEFTRIPYLGAPPNIRAMAEDKWLMKLAFSGLHLPVAPGVVIGKLSEPPSDPPQQLNHVKRFFVKKRFGAASDCITEANIADSWQAAVDCARSLNAQGHDALIEEFCPGTDYTVPVIGGPEDPTILGFVKPGSDKKEGILTGDLKLHDHLGYGWADLPEQVQQQIRGDVMTVWRGLGPIDYFRLDYRIDPSTGTRRLIEMNICCYIGKSGPFAMGAEKWGLSHGELMKAILQYSLDRQRHFRTNSRCII